MQSGTKTVQPVSYLQAKTIYDRLVREKTAKGYTPGEEGDGCGRVVCATQAPFKAPELLVLVRCRSRPSIRLHSVVATRSLR
jgi:hypothetical protein